MKLKKLQTEYIFKQKGFLNPRPVSSGVKRAATKRGFTLVEALVAVTVLLLGITGPMVIVSNSIRTSSIAQDQISAYYFAQEGIEYVRYVRDSNIVATPPRPWLTNLGNCMNPNPTPCDIDDPRNSVVDNGGFDNCLAGGCPRIRYNNGQNIFQSNNGPRRNFSRDIRVSVSGNEAVVTVIVTWTTGGTTRTYTLSESMFNWSGT